MKRITFLFVMLAISSSQASANEAEDYCNLVKAQAGARSSTLAWPKLFASYGDPYATGARIIGGMSLSLSGFIQALVVNNISSNQCRFYGANRLLRDSVLHLDSRIFLMQTEAQRPVLAEALRLAEVNVDIEKQLFDAQNSTLVDLSEAYATRDRIQLSLLTIEQKYNSLQEIPTLDADLDLREQLAESKKSQAKVAALTSAIDTLLAWDVVGSAGVKHDLAFGATAGFASVGLTYSFGHIPSAIKSSRVDGLMRKYLDGQYESPQNIYLRQIRSQKENLLSEEKNKNYIENQLNSVKELLDRANTADSIRAKRAQRNLAIQQLTQKAALVASTIKIDELERWLGTNAE